MKTLIFTAIIAISFVLISCEKSEDSSVNEHAYLIAGEVPAYSTTVHKALKCIWSRYRNGYLRVDLNDDEKDDILIHISGTIALGGGVAGEFWIEPLNTGVRIVSEIRIDTLCSYSGSTGFVVEVYDPKKNYPSDLQLEILERPYLKCYKQYEKIYFDRVRKERSYLYEFKGASYYGNIEHYNFHADFPYSIPFFIGIRVYKAGDYHYAWLKIEIIDGDFYIRESFFR